MNRRHFLSAMGALATAGCTGSSESAGSPWNGPTEEDREYVDLQWREWTDAEIAEKKDAAEQLSYDDLRRNVEEHVGTTIQFRGLVYQTLEGDAFYFLLGYNSLSDGVYASWTGDRYIRGDVLQCWGHVLGVEVYRSNGAEQSVPALSLVDVELIEEG